MLYNSVGVTGFEPATTRPPDDCYTPTAVYDAVLNYVFDHYTIPEGQVFLKEEIRFFIKHKDLSAGMQYFVSVSQTINSTTKNLQKF